MVAGVLLPALHWRHPCRAAMAPTALGILDGPSQLRRRFSMPVHALRFRTVQASTMSVLVVLYSMAANSQPVLEAPVPPSLAALAPAVTSEPETQAFVAVAASNAVLVEERTGLAAALQLADDINAVKAEKLRYVEEWNGTAAECEARKQGLFGGMAKACRQTMMALARGEVFRFAFECYRLTSRHSEMLANVSSETDVLLASSGRELATFCSKDTYQNQYPAFATLYAEAEARGAGGRRSGGMVRLSPETDRFNILPPTAVYDAPMMEQPFIALPAAQ
jgi:hypothetical protein